MINAIFGNWKTTLLGAVGAVALYLQGQGGVWAIVAAICVALVGAVAKDASTGSKATGGP